MRLRQIEKCHHPLLESLAPESGQLLSFMAGTPGGLWHPGIPRGLGFGVQPLNL